MVQENKFCTNCGTPLEKGNKFCGSCGRPVTASSVQELASSPATPVVTSPSSPVTLEEKIIGIIPAVSRKKGLMSLESFNVIVTERRMIFALMTNEMVKEEAKKAGKEGGFLAKMAGAMTVGYTLYRRYFDMAPDAALKENPGNFSIDLNQVKKVKLLEGKLRMDNNRRKFYDNSKLELETAGGKYSFDVPRNFHDDAKGVLQTIRMV